MESKSQDNFPLVEQVRLKILNDIENGGTQSAIAEAADISKPAINRFVKGKNIDCVNFAKLLVFYGFIKDVPQKSSGLIDEKILKKHRFIKKVLEEINNPATNSLPPAAAIKISINILNSELIREEALQK